MSVLDARQGKMTHDPLGKLDIYRFVGAPLYSRLVEVLQLPGKDSREPYCRTIAIACACASKLGARDCYVGGPLLDASPVPTPMGSSGALAGFAVGQVAFMFDDTNWMHGAHHRCWRHTAAGKRSIVSWGITPGHEPTKAHDMADFLYCLKHEQLNYNLLLTFVDAKDPQGVQEALDQISLPRQQLAGTMTRRVIRGLIHGSL